MGCMFLFGFIKWAAQLIFGKGFERALLIIGGFVGDDLGSDDLLLFEGVVELLLELEDAGFLWGTVWGHAWVHF